ncbi:MAG: histidinol dehydrogenase [Cyanobium sp. MAG_237]|nr:histidinol dehydrogenase [Cyanobium sp. MAG_237]
MVATPVALSISCLRDDGSNAAADRLATIAERTSGGRLREEMVRVEEILARVQAEGDAALMELTERFDGVRPDPLRIAPQRLAVTAPVQV